jgi:hypothetical protein
MATMLLGGLWHGAGFSFVLWGGLHGFFLIVHRQFCRCAPVVPRPLRAAAAACGHALTLICVIVAWVPFRAGNLHAAGTMLAGLAGWHGLTLPQLVTGLVPPLAAFATPVPVLRYLGDARTLSFPEATACLLLGWAIVLLMPNTQELTQRQRRWALTGCFAFTAQALFFAPSVSPFLYFRF